MIINHVNKKKWNVGFKRVEVKDTPARQSLPMLVMYPSNTPEITETITRWTEPWRTYNIGLGILCRLSIISSKVNGVPIV